MRYAPNWIGGLFAFCNFIAGEDCDLWMVGSELGRTSQHVGVLSVRRGFEYDYVFDWTIVECMESLQRRSREVGLGLEDERGFRIVALVLDW